MNFGRMELLPRIVPHMSFQEDCRQLAATGKVFSVPDDSDGDLSTDVVASCHSKPRVDPEALGGDEYILISTSRDKSANSTTKVPVSKIAKPSGHINLKRHLIDVEGWKTSEYQAFEVSLDNLVR